MWGRGISIRPLMAGGSGTHSLQNSILRHAGSAGGRHGERTWHCRGFHAALEFIRNRDESIGTGTVADGGRFFTKGFRISGSHRVQGIFPVWTFMRRWWR